MAQAAKCPPRGLWHLAPWVRRLDTQARAAALHGGSHVQAYSRRHPPQLSSDQAAGPPLAPGLQQRVPSLCLWPGHTTQLSL